MDNNINEEYGIFPALWYKKRWGKIVLVVIAAVILLLIVFASRVFYFYYQIKTGKMSPEQAPLDISIPDNYKELSKRLVTTDDPQTGSPNAKVKIVEFSDFECPYCRQAYPIVRQIIKDYGNKILFVYRDFPIVQHAEAQKAAEAGECAQDQGKFWELHDLIFANQENITVPDIKKYAVQAGIKNLDAFYNCLDSDKYANEVKKDLYDGSSAGVEGTPTFFINGIKVGGVIPEVDFKAIIEELLK